MILTTVTIMTMMFTTTSMILITANHKKGNATNKNKANNKNNKPQQQKNKKYKYLVHTASNLLSSPNSQKSRPATHDVFHSKPHVPHGWNSGAN